MMTCLQPKTSMCMHLFMIVVEYLSVWPPAIRPTTMMRMVNILMGHTKGHPLSSCQPCRVTAFFFFLYIFWRPFCVGGCNDWLYWLCEIRFPVIRNGIICFHLSWTKSVFQKLQIQLLLRQRITSFMPQCILSNTNCPLE